MPDNGNSSSMNNNNHKSNHDAYDKIVIDDNSLNEDLKQG